MKRPKLLEIIHAILDKRLYGFSFLLSSGTPLAVGFVIEVLIEYALNRQTLLFYVPLFIALVLVSGLGSKNYGHEVPNMGHFRGFLFLIASVLAATTPFLLKFPDDLNGLFQFLLIFAISTLALTIAIVEVTIFGQRVSLRNSIRLTDDFFKKQKKVWEKELEGFPNSEKIINCLDDGKFVAGLFDRGSFNLAILWSCNVMEEIIDAAADGIIQKDPLKKPSFKKEKGGSQRYPLQLKNLNYVHHQRMGRRNEQISIDDLWDKVRNKVAHHNYKPTFNETYGALIILVSFIQDMPKTLLAYKSAVLRK
jgi:hypothetical protein